MQRQHQLKDQCVAVVEVAAAAAVAATAALAPPVEAFRQDPANPNFTVEGIRWGSLFKAYALLQNPSLSLTTPTPNKCKTKLVTRACVITFIR